MKKDQQLPYHVNAVSEQHRILSLPKPQHPLVSVFNFEDVRYNKDPQFSRIMFNLYCIAIKKGCSSKVRYGQNYYDFDEGVMSFLSPNQFLSDISLDSPPSGWCLVFHPDFIQNYPLGKAIKNYGFFSYAANEALHLSQKEEDMVTSIMKNIEQEYRSSIDTYSQDVIVSHIDLLLNYSNRFYNRQFITRRNANNDLLTNLESILSEYFNGEEVREHGLPSVQYISSRLNVSANYLSDMLRNLTGQNTQQHIHNKLIDKAKEILATTNLSVAEIAYQLGFEYPQSFSKLFKSKTSLSPLEFRHSFN